MKILFKLVKNVCLGIFAIYSINVLFSTIGINIPINLYSIFMSSFLGLSGIISMIILVLLI